MFRCVANAPDFTALHLGYARFDVSGMYKSLAVISIDAVSSRFSRPGLDKEGGISAAGLVGAGHARVLLDLQLYRIKETWRTLSAWSAQLHRPIPPVGVGCARVGWAYGVVLFIAAIKVSRVAWTHLNHLANAPIYNKLL